MSEMVVRWTWKETSNLSVWAERYWRDSMRDEMTGESRWDLGLFRGWMPGWVLLGPSSKEEKGQNKHVFFMLPRFFQFQLCGWNDKCIEMRAWEKNNSSDTESNQLCSFGKFPCFCMMLSWRKFETRPTSSEVPSAQADGSFTTRVSCFFADWLHGSTCAA